MLLRLAVSMACGGDRMDAKDEDIGQQKGSYSDEAADFQEMVENYLDRTLGSPGRAFAAIRQRLPCELRARAQRLVRARSQAAHLAR